MMITTNEAPHIVVGKTGEGVATRFLRGIGYIVLARNVRLAKDEIDIVAWDPEDRVIVFAEVKARAHSSSEFHGFLNLDKRKHIAMTRAARAWVAAHNWEGGYRLDVICVSENHVIEHVREYPWATTTTTASGQ